MPSQIYISTPRSIPNKTTRVSQTQPLTHERYPTKPISCHLDTVASTPQVLNTVKQMGLLSGMLARGYAHSLRFGSIRDFAHTSKKAADTLPTLDEVRSFAGHSRNTMNNGVTEHYVGAIARDVYNLRAENGGVRHRQEPKFPLDKDKSLELVKGPVSDQELQEYLHQIAPGTDAKTLTHGKKRTLRDQLRRQRMDEFLGTAPVEPIEAYVRYGHTISGYNFEHASQSESPQATLLAAKVIADLSEVPT